MKLELEIIPRWNVIIEIEEDVDTTEGKVLTVAGSVAFSNISDTWRANNSLITVIVTFINETGTYSKTLTLRTDEEGKFIDESIVLPSEKNYQFINITVILQGSRYNLPSETISGFKIEIDLWNRYYIPLIISLIAIAIGVPVGKKYIIPYMQKKIPKTNVYIKLASNKKIQELYAKVTNDTQFLTAQDAKPEGIDAIKTIKIPHLPDNLEVYSKVEESADEDTIPTDDIDLIIEEQEEQINRPLLDTIKRINSRIKSIQDLFAPEISDESLLKYKNDSLLKGKLLEEQKNYPDAIVNYYFAQEYARRLGLEDEVLMLESSMNRLLVQMDARDQLKFIKQYKLQAQKERMRKA